MHEHQGHTWWLKDAAGIELAKVCSECEASTKRRIAREYRPEVLRDPSYESDEPKECDW